MPQNSNSQAVLKARAAALAQRSEPPPDPFEFIEVLEFTLRRCRWAFPSRRVREASPLKNFIPVPGAPNFVRGVMNLRGQIMTVADLGPLLDLPREGLSDLAIVIVVDAGEFDIGILADAILGVRLVRTSELQWKGTLASGAPHDSILGVTPDRTTVIDSRKLPLLKNDVRTGAPSLRSK